MKTLEIQIPDEVAAKAEAAAQQRGVTLEELLRASLDETLDRDMAFDAAARAVLEKNAELYKRLA